MQRYQQKELHAKDFKHGHPPNQGYATHKLSETVGLELTADLKQKQTTKYPLPSEGITQDKILTGIEIARSWTPRMTPCLPRFHARQALVHMGVRMTMPTSGFQQCYHITGKDLLTWNWYKAGIDAIRRRGQMCSATLQSLTKVLGRFP